MIRLARKTQLRVIFCLLSWGVGLTWCGTGEGEDGTSAGKAQSQANPWSKESQLAASTFEDLLPLTLNFYPWVSLVGRQARNMMGLCLKARGHPAYGPGWEDTPPRGLQQHDVADLNQLNHL